MSGVKRTIIYKNKEYNVLESLIEKVENGGVKFDDNYLQYVLENDNPFAPFNINFLIHFDIQNRLYIGENTVLGKIIKIEKSSKITKVFNTVYDAMIDAINSDDFYIFENVYYNTYDKSKVKNGDSKEAFDEIFNSLINGCKEKYFRTDPTLNMFYNPMVANKMSFDDFISQYIRWNCFMIGSYFSNEPIVEI